MFKPLFESSSHWLPWVGWAVALGILHVLHWAFDYYRKLRLIRSVRRPLSLEDNLPGSLSNKYAHHRDRFNRGIRQLLAPGDFIANLARDEVPFITKGAYYPYKAKYDGAALLCVSCALQKLNELIQTS